MSSDRRVYPRVKIKWPVKIKTEEGTMDGVMLNISPGGCFIGCPRPLKLNVVFELSIKVPDSDASIAATAEVVWSNIYGPDDEISPRGMGVQFIKISGQGRKFIAQTSLKHLKAQKVDPELLETLHTLVIDLSEEKKRI